MRHHDDSSRSSSCPPRNAPHLGLRQLELPKLTVGTAQWLQRQPARRSPAEVQGQALYLPRLDATMLAHEPVVGGWLCTAVAVAGLAPGRLPTGVAVVDELELLTGLEVANPWFPQADLTAEQFAEVWLLRERDSAPSSDPGRLALAIVKHLERDSLQVPTNPRAHPRLKTSAGIIYDRALNTALQRLVDRGFLTALFTGQDDVDRRYGLRLPQVRWVR